MSDKLQEVKNSTRTRSYKDDWGFEAKNTSMPKESYDWLVATVERLRAMYQAEYDNSQVLIGQINGLLRREKGYLAELADYGRTVTRLRESK